MEKVKRLYGNLKTHKNIYEIWKSMNQRCNNKNNKRYNKYKDVYICEQWRGKFGSMNFIIWSYNNGYKKGLTIDRIDNCGNYCPDNCRWTDYKTQNNNKSSNKFITYNGKTQTLKQWSKELGINYSCLRSRISRKVPLEKAMSVQYLR